MVTHDCGHMSMFGIMVLVALTLLLLGCQVLPWRVLSLSLSKPAARAIATIVDIEADVCGADSTTES